MFEYTTEMITLTINGVDFAHVEKFRVAINGRKGQVLKVIEADDPAIDTDAHTVSVPLSQTDTASFGNGKIYIQARLVMDDGNVVATDIVKQAVNLTLDRVIV